MRSFIKLFDLIIAVARLLENELSIHELRTKKKFVEGKTTVPTTRFERVIFACLIQVRRRNHLAKRASNLSYMAVCE
jgi:hypothetical protein